MIFYISYFYIHISSCNNFWSFRKVFLLHGRIPSAEFFSTWLLGLLVYPVFFICHKMIFRPSAKRKTACKLWPYCSLQ
jgi:hypothetical protein